MLAPRLILRAQTGSQAFEWFVGLKKAICWLLSRLVFTRCHTQSLKGEKDHFGILVSFLKHSWPYPCHASSRLCQVRGTSTNQNKKRKEDNEDIAKSHQFQDLRKELWQIWCCLSCNFQPDSEIKKKCAESAVLSILILRILKSCPTEFSKLEVKIHENIGNQISLRNDLNFGLSFVSSSFSLDGGRQGKILGAWLRLEQVGYQGSKSCAEHKSHQAKSLSSPAVQGFCFVVSSRLKKPRNKIKPVMWNSAKQIWAVKKQLVHPPKNILVG